MKALLWFRQDLRIEDHPALLQACREAEAVIPVYIWDDSIPWAPGGAARWWLHHSLDRLQTQLRAIGSDLVVRQGEPQTVLRQLQQETGAQALYVHQLAEPAAKAAEAQLSGLFERLVRVSLSQSQLLFEPESVLTGQRTPYRVFKPFRTNCLSREEPRAPLPAPTRIPTPEVWPESLPLAELQLLPDIDWAGGFRDFWQPERLTGPRQLQDFLEVGLAGYEPGRDFPAAPLTSRLSPYLHWGEISPHQAWQAVRSWEDAAPRRSSEKASAQTFLRELLFREFAHHLLYHLPTLPDQPLDKRFADFEWEADTELRRAWEQGRTGYPIVDAGMRQLWATGWMHNRVRMIVGSFLVKDLLISWQEGERWFWDTLVDANLANNAFNWQWVGGCGADASPFFRVFNPTLQGQKFDPKGEYVRAWVPELARLPERWIHQPEQAPEAVLRQAGVVLGQTYPEPVVRHDRARDRALARYRAMRGAPA